MPKVGNNNEPLLERAMFGYDGSLWKPLTLDANGYLEVALPLTEVIEVTQDTAADLLATVTIPTGQDIEARSYSNIGAAWQKQPLLLGYSGQITEKATETSDGGSPTTANSTVVPAGEIHEIRSFVCWHDDGTARLTTLAMNDGSNEITLAINTSLAQNVSMFIPIPIVLKEGDKMVVNCYSLASGKNLNFGLVGIRVDIDL